MRQNNMMIFVDTASIAYMNSADNFRGVSHTADDDIEMMFASATTADAYDIVLLSCPDEKHVEAIKALARAVHGVANKPFTVIADDVNGIYCNDNITAVESITLAKKSRTINVKTWSTALDLAAVDSGSLIVTGDATAGVLKLPVPATVGMGWFVDVHINHDQTTNATKIECGTNGGVFVGGVAMLDFDTDGEGAHFQANGSSNDFMNLNANTKGNKPGGNLRFVCDGTNFHVSGILVGESALGTPFADS